MTYLVTEQIVDPATGEVLGMRGEQNPDRLMDYLSAPPHKWPAWLIDALRDNCEYVDTVGDSHKCPNCGENRVDELVWQDDPAIGEYVWCASCGEEYDPNAPDDDSAATNGIWSASA